jgi:hypothetical protein
MKSIDILEQPELFKGKIPSARTDILKGLERDKVTCLVRYSWDSPSEIEKILKEDFDAPSSSVFRRSYGPLLVTLESGLILGFGEEPSEASVVVWVEKSRNGQKRPEGSLLDDDEVYRIDALDSTYSEQFVYDLVGKEISHVSIIKRDNPRWAREVAGEVGVVLGFNNSPELIISWDLYANIDSFALALRNEIDPEIIDQLQEIPL